MPRWSSGRPTVTFIACAYGISWIAGIAATSLLKTTPASFGAVGPYIAGAVITWGPALAALIVAEALNDAKGRRALLAQLAARSPFRLWYVALPLSATLATMGSLVAAGIAPGAVWRIFAESWPLLAAHLALQFVFVGVGEELGWRGWLLPRLCRRHSLGWATTLTFAAWAVWHVPKFAFLGPRYAGPAVAVLGAGSVIFSLLWVRARGSILAVAFAHAAINAPFYFVEQVSHSVRLKPETLLDAWAWFGAMAALVAVLLVMLTRSIWNRSFYPEAVAAAVAPSTSSRGGA
jgi:membrane protease YdiL (CAAX protease family)